MDGVYSYDHKCSSAQSTPRSSATASGSSQSFCSGSSKAESLNYSFQQRKLKIPPDMKRVDAAMLESSLIQQQLPQKLTPILNETLPNKFALDDLTQLPSLTPTSGYSRISSSDLKPHPPISTKKMNKPRRCLQQRADSQSTSDHESRRQSTDDIRADKGECKSSIDSKEGLDSLHNSDLESQNKFEVENDRLPDKCNIVEGDLNSKSVRLLQASNFGLKADREVERLAVLLRKNLHQRRQALEKNKNVESAPVSDHNSAYLEGNKDGPAVVRKESLIDNDKLILRKSDEESVLINSYENYLRQLSKSEEERAETDGNHEGSNSCSDSSSSSSSISVSSLSDNEDDGDLSPLEDENTLKLDPSSRVVSDNFDPLYSLPVKDKEPSPFLKPLISDESSLLNDSMLSETSRNRYAELNESLPCNDLRTQSVPDLRTGKSFRTFDTMGYLCPKFNSAGRQITSSPDIKKENFHMKYRPLPDIPIETSQPEKIRDNDREEATYEAIQTQDMRLSPVDKPRISFKAVANRVVSLMPRLTTKEARSREADRYMADIMQYLPDQVLRVYCGTWNMKGIKVMPEFLDDYILPQESMFIQDIYAIGCQEGTPFRKEWEIRLQETLGPTHVLMYSGNFGVLHLSIFVRRELVWFCTGIEQDTVATRIAHKIKTKGAIAVCFNLFGTSLLFINSHFASNQEKLRERVKDYRTIIQSLNIPFSEEMNSQNDVTSRFDRVFWLGDFNFRINKKRAEADQIFAKRNFDNQQERKQFIISELLQHDQLCQLVDKGKIFHGFREASINFLPTYKFDVNTDIYDTSPKARVPSWTDRILHKSKQPDHIKVTSYNSCTTIKCSDHRPVFCIMETKIEPAKKHVQLPGAMFDRDIYIEANMRRSAPTGNQHASNVCTIL